MHPLSLLCAAFLAVGFGGSSAEPKLAFQRGDDMWVVKADGTEPQKIGKGTAPVISPDGSKLTYVTNGPSSGELTRWISVVDLNEKAATVFKKQIPSANCQLPIWSPDGSTIFFYLFVESNWEYGAVQADGSDFRYVRKATGKIPTAWSPTFAPDGESFYGQDLENIYQFDLHGKIQKKWLINSLVPDGGMSSGSQLAVSPDGQSLLLTVELEEAGAEEGGPLPTIWKLHLSTGKISRITPKDVVAWAPCWLDDENILFVTQGAKEKNPSIYRAKSDGSESKVLIKNADLPSVSR